MMPTKGAVQPGRERTWPWASRLAPRRSVHGDQSSHETTGVGPSALTCTPTVPLPLRGCLSPSHGLRLAKVCVGPMGEMWAKLSPPVCAAPGTRTCGPDPGQGLDADSGPDARLTGQAADRRRSGSLCGRPLGNEPEPHGSCPLKVPPGPHPSPLLGPPTMLRIK